MKPAVSGVDNGQVASLVEEWPLPSLAGWYGNSLTHRQATALQAAAQRLLCDRLRQGRAGFRPRLLQLVCRFWLGSAVELEYASLAAAAGNDYERALLELVFGQLLISRKCRRALPHLQAGFNLAAGYLEPADYFRLLRRHELLGYLGLGDGLAPARNLAVLLTEAAVIERLRSGEGRQFESTHRDTVG
jgi:hypothetical protein